MTREEAIETIKDICLTTEQLTHIEEALECLLSQPSLPSNLDEAAEKNFETMKVLEHENIFEETHNRIFKSGAEWMAGQGYTTEKTVNRTPLNGPAGICLNLHDSTGLKIGDKVIVQVRKKQ